jgi:hypothetical protein
MKHAGVVIFVASLVGGCGGSTVCERPVLCPGRTNASYVFCNAGSDGCYYVGQDGSKFSCRSCGDCASAQATAIGWCATAPADITPRETCEPSSCSGKSYQYCTSADGKSCRYVTSDGREFKCVGCTDCSGAASQLTAWCAPVTTSCSTKPTPTECYNCCTIANPTGYAYVRNNLFPCFCSACSFDCASSQYCGGTAIPSTACATCASSALQGSCGAWVSACMADAACKAYSTCVSGCQ